MVADDESEAMGVVTLIYDHHAGRIAERLTELQHLHLDRVVTTTHVHLDARRCLEVILLRGPAGLIRELADGLIGTKGVETGRLVLAAAAPVAGRGEKCRRHSSWAFAFALATTAMATTTIIALRVESRRPTGSLELEGLERRGFAVVDLGDLVQADDVCPDPDLGIQARRT